MPQDNIATKKKAVKRFDLWTKVGVDIEKEILERRKWVMYKTIPEWMIKNKGEKIFAAPSKEFFSFVTDQVNAYVHDQKEPPAEIAPAIMNIADDHMDGREPVIRAGDYISIQNYMRAKKLIK